MLRQNPRIAAGRTSPVGAIFTSMLSATSQRNEGAVFIDDAQRQRLLRACFDAYYAETEAEVVLDSNRQWTTKLPALVSLFPDCRMVCCVRNPAWIVDSIERLVKRNAFELSGIFSFDPAGTVYSRADGLSKSDGMLGFAYAALREAVYGPHAERLLLVRYETLTANPLAALAAVYAFIGEELFPHDPEHIEPCYEMVEFDMRLGTPGLHDVGRAVRASPRPTVLPPDLFERYQGDAFWNDAARLPKEVSII